MSTIKEKKYTWKVYALNWDFKFTINPTDVKAGLVFDSTLNSWQGQFNLIFNKTIDYTGIVNTDIIRIYQIDKSFPDWRIIYAGIVQDVTKKITADFEEIIVPMLWLWSIFTYKTFNWTKDDTPWNIIWDMVDLINIDYNLFTKHITTTWNDVKLDLEYETLLKIITKTKQASEFNFFVWADWIVHFHEKPLTPTHEFQLWKEVFDLQIKDNSEKLVNKLILKYDNSTRIYEDATSQTNYWLREKYISDMSIKQNDSADEFWNQYIEDNKNPISETVIKINDEYDIETIQPWDTITIYDTVVQNMQVVKTKYYMDWITLYLEKFENFGSEFNYLQK